MSVPQAPHAVLCVCTGCLGMEDFTAYAVCLPRYPFLGHHQAHPVLMPRARKVPGSWDSRCAQDILQVLTSWRYSAQCHLFAVEPQMQETWALSGHRAGHLGLHSCWPLGSGEELSPSSSRLFPGLIPATTDKTKLDTQLSPWGPVSLLPFISWGSGLFARLGGRKPHGSLILLYECFPMDYRRG